MPKPPLIYDALRLFLGSSRPHPRGIDRVEQVYIQAILNDWPQDCFGLLPTPWGIRLYERQELIAGWTRIAELWGEHTPADRDTCLLEVSAFLAGERASSLTAPAAPAQRWGASVTGPARVLARTGIKRGIAAKTVAQGAIYLNVGQLGWAAGVTTGWLARRTDVRAVFMMHDMLPLDYPEMFSRAGRWSHERMLGAVARRAHGVICTTEAAKQRIAAGLASTDHQQPLIRALHLPVSAAFLAPPTPMPALSQAHAAAPYFVISGAIETRKNLGVLLAAWHHLIAAHGHAAPRLVIAGTPAAHSEAVLRALRDATALHAHVTVASGLSTAALCHLVRGARAALMPSWAEGFGLPVMEALTLGTPVIASDLPAHREVGGMFPTYLPPDDAQAWAAAIAQHAAQDGTDQVRRAMLAQFRPMTSDTYFAAVRSFLQEVAEA